MLKLTDQRDLFHEIVGEGGWKVGHKLYTMIHLIPEFIQEMYLIEDDLYTVGIFHLGQVYSLRPYVNPAKGSNVYAC